MPTMADPGTQLANVEDLGGPTPENSKPDDDSNKFGNRINNINFVVEQQLNLPNISSSESSGINTSRIIIDKN